MIRTIVTGVDTSETAARAARTAAELAVSLGADLHVISAYGKLEVETFSSGSEEFIASNEGDAEQVANDVVLRLRSDLPSLKVVAAAAGGKPGDALVRYAEEVNADLIVVGNKRVQGIARVLGSIARDVASQAHCDVYVAHTQNA